MKRTFLLIAVLIIGATSANAQRFISADALTVKNKTAKTPFQIMDHNIQKQSSSRTKDAFVYGTPVMTVNFSLIGANANYTFQNLTGHTAGASKGMFSRMDTSSTSTTLLQSTYPILYGYFGVANYGYRFFAQLVGGKVGDGFAIVAPYEVYNADGSNTKAYNTAIKCTDGFATTNFNTVDVVFNQYTQRFNNDRYYIDYSTDVTFNTYDSIEFNVKGIELNSNDEAYGQKRVTLPVASTVGQANLYIRLRYKCLTPTGNEVSQPSGYWWMVDEINVYDGPAQRIDEISTNHYMATYGIVPEGMTMDTLRFRAVIENTGGNTLYGSSLEEKYHTATDIQLNPIVFNTDLNYTNNSIEPTDITTAIRVDTTRDANEVITSLDVRRYVTLWAETARIYNQTAGLYGISEGVKYLQTQGGTTYLHKALEDSIYYRVSAMPQSSTTESALWACDMDVLIKGSAWADGMAGDKLVTDNTSNAKEPGYTVCNRFITPTDLQGAYYAKGIEVVPAADSCTAGVILSASLKYFVDAATTLEEAIKPVLKNNNEVVSDNYTISADNLNNGLFTNATMTTEFHSINMPFNQSGILLEPGIWYYACYKIIDNNGGNSKFYVAQDNNKKYSSFKEIDNWARLVATPGMESFEDATWGSRFGFYCDNNAPMIRLKVSQNPSSLNDITTASFNLNAYPNPARNEATIEYTLNNNGNVVITLTDIMGRNVLTMNKGNQASNTTYRVALNTNTLNNGTYFYTLNVNGVKETKKLVINK